jgi:hypothetical protein
LLLFRRRHWLLRRQPCGLQRLGADHVLTCEHQGTESQSRVCLYMSRSATMTLWRVTKE